MRRYDSSQSCPCQLRRFYLLLTVLSLHSCLLFGTRRHEHLDITLRWSSTSFQASSSSFWTDFPHIGSKWQPSFRPPLHSTHSAVSRSRVQLPWPAACVIVDWTPWHLRPCVWPQCGLLHYRGVRAGQRIRVYPTGLQYRGVRAGQRVRVYPTGLHYSGVRAGQRVRVYPTGLHYRGVRWAASTCVPYGAIISRGFYTSSGDHHRRSSANNTSSRCSTVAQRNSVTCSRLP